MVPERPEVQPPASVFLLKERETQGVVGGWYFQCVSSRPVLQVELLSARFFRARAIVFLSKVLELASPGACFSNVPAEVLSVD